MVIKKTRLMVDSDPRGKISTLSPVRVRTIFFFRAKRLPLYGDKDEK